ncbi:MAG: hypothetical protein Q4E62_07340, partial [Sutterellaceae bacterium]|nr:hypothetical protein [Sutterellaceae bacterium]
PSEITKAKIVLRVFLGDVFLQDSEVYMTNSKKALTPFEVPPIEANRNIPTEEFLKDDSSEATVPKEEVSEIAS